MYGLSQRWYALRYHPIQDAFFNSSKRFNICHAGRRSGKTEIDKRKLVLKATIAHDKNFGVSHIHPPPYNFFAAAPTREQAKNIYWSDLKRLVPKEFMLDDPIETELKISLINGANIRVLGMDKPERAEGQPWDGGILDEYGNMKPEVWTEHLRPVLSEFNGWCDFIGVPEGRNHYYQLVMDAESLFDWAVFWWPSIDILSIAEVEQAKNELDELSFDQEYNGSFVSFKGRAYYAFNRVDNVTRKLVYNPKGDLIFCFDFNVDPGVAAVCQEAAKMDTNFGVPLIGTQETHVIDEVYIEKNSNTQKICEQLLKKFEHHEGRIFCYGDATGGSRSTSGVLGTDWQIIKMMLKPVFEERLIFRVTRQNPPVRDRINAVNSRCRSLTGNIRLLIDPHCKHTIIDFEGVVLKPDGSGDLDKSEKNKNLTHLTDAIGYYIEKEFPIVPRKAFLQEI